MKRVLWIAAASAVVAVSIQAPRVRAQTPPPAATFEVASVKANKSGDQRVMIGIAPGGRFTASNVATQFLLVQAFNVQDFQIVDGPDWVRSDRFDVIAKTPETGDGAVSADQMRPMLRALLEDRFKLTAHTETREMPIYSLVTARSDGKLGSALSPAATDCSAARGRRGGGPPTIPQPGQQLDCGMMIGPGTINAGGIVMPELARNLSRLVGRVVLDKTGLTGGYDFQLTFAPQQLGGGGQPVLNGAPVSADPNAPNLFTALQEQLGLKLGSDRGPVEVVVIDHIEQPTAD